MPVVDTSVLVGVQRRDREALQLHDRCIQGAGPVWIPAAAWMEYLAVIPPAKHAVFDEEMEKFAVIAEFDREMAVVAARMQYNLLQSGHRKGWTDIQIAATAHVLAEPVVTMDRDFDIIPGIEVLHP